MTHAHDPEPTDPGLIDSGRRELAVLVAVALGGIVGAEARYAIAAGLPHDPDAWPWSTLIANVAGSLLIGVLMVIVLERYRPHHLIRPFLGVGVLGGFTTFSTFSVDLIDLLRAHRALLALGYAAASILACLVAVVAGLALTRVALPDVTP